MKKILLTGSAGFIGFHISRRLLEEGYEIVTIDSLTDYYDINLKKDRLAILQEYPGFTFHQTDLADKPALLDVFKSEKIDDKTTIIHMAAQPGVRYSLINPDSYVQRNFIATYNLLEAARLAKCSQMIYASSSSVYGGNQKLPFSVEDGVNHPVSLYAATKKATELLAHVYSYSYGLPTTGLRLFTVYGPWGRPDMSPILFAKGITAGEPLKVFNYGDMQRDFTYVDDIVEGIVRLIDHPATPDPDWNGEDPSPATSWLPYRVYNIGNNKVVKLMDFINAIASSLGIQPKLDMQPMQLGDIKATFADIDATREAIGFQPKTSIEVGVPKFVEWFKSYYK